MIHLNVDDTTHKFVMTEEIGDTVEVCNQCLMLLIEDHNKQIDRAEGVRRNYNLAAETLNSAMIQVNNLRTLLLRTRFSRADRKEINRIVDSLSDTVRPPAHMVQKNIDDLMRMIFKM